METGLSDFLQHPVNFYSFLNTEPEHWKSHESFLKVKNTVTTLRVNNDLAERDVAPRVAIGFFQNSQDYVIKNPFLGIRPQIAKKTATKT